MLYTRTGDSGTSGLYGTRERLPKDSPVFEALGTLDELNSLLGLCRLEARAAGKFDISENLISVQECLFMLQAEIAGADQSILQKKTEALENMINLVEDTIGSPNAFVIPGATKLSSLCDYARTVARRAERRVVHLLPAQLIAPESLTYMNRLSSYLYALARQDAAVESTQELHPAYK